MLDLLHGDRFIFYFYAHHSLWGLTPMWSQGKGSGLYPAIRTGNAVH